MIKRIKYKIRSFFGFSSFETNGLLVLIPLLFLILWIPEGVKQVLLASDTSDAQGDKKLLEEWYKESQARLRIKEKKEKMIVPNFFNPNKITKEKWIALGFKGYVADNVINYRSKGGKFRKKEDLLKIYGINQKLVKSYDNYIIIPVERKGKIRGKGEWKRKYSKASKFKKALVSTAPKNETVILDLNVADSTDMVVVRGIGSFLSGKILEYRNKLGGFVSKEQLREVYGMREENYQLVESKFVIGEKPISRININQDSIKILLKHPYISYKTSLAIVKYRRQHGDYQSVAELKKIYTISDDLYRKLEPYLTISVSE